MCMSLQKEKAHVNDDANDDAQMRGPLHHRSLALYLSFPKRGRGRGKKKHPMCPVSCWCCGRSCPILGLKKIHRLHIAPSMDGGGECGRGTIV